MALRPKKMSGTVEFMRLTCSPAFALVGVGTVVVAVAMQPPPGQSKKPPTKPVQASFERDVKPLITKYCAGCHSGKNAAGGHDLGSVKTHAQMVANISMWDRVGMAMASDRMPPASSPQPDQKAKRSMLDSIQTILSNECRLADPGRVTLRRLNREEYNNSVRDLTGLDLRLADDFPSDDVGYGFDNIGDVLSLTTLQIDNYLAAAQTIASQAITVSDKRRVSFSPESMITEGGVNTNGDVAGIYAHGSVIASFKASSAGPYAVDITAYGQQAGPENTKMRMLIDSRSVGTFEVKAVREKPERYSQTVDLTAGTHRIEAEFINDYYQPNAPDPKDRDRNLYIEEIAIEGPMGGTKTLSNHEKVLLSGPLSEANLPEAIRRLAKRAYRRPPSEDELARLQKLADLAAKDKEPVERQYQLVLEAVLCSPNFLFRVELDQAKGARSLNDYEIASRLSYFLWSSMPDEILLDLAGKKKLHQPEIMVAQVKRMLADPKAAALADNFAGQWLQLRKLNVVMIDPAAFPDYNETLRDAMMEETKLYFQGILAGNRSILEFLQSDYSYLNEPLAKLYGVSGVTGAQLRKANLPNGLRGGLLGQASILTLTSNPTRTSPVKRGKWVLENILGSPPPPPPPGTVPLPEDGADAKGLTMRERMAIHRTNPECASCHIRLDAIGMALENFNGIGKWRTMDQGAPIEPVTDLPEGTKIQGLDGLQSYLLRQKDKFCRNLVEKLLVYAVGRGVRPEDRCFTDAIVKRTKADGYKMQSIVCGIVLSDPFLKKGDVKSK